MEGWKDGRKDKIGAKVRGGIEGGGSHKKNDRRKVSFELQELQVERVSQHCACCADRFGQHACITLAGDVQKKNLIDQSNRPKC